jgi:exodeoxyribonuclease VII large subunit
MSATIDALLSGDAAGLPGGPGAGAIGSPAPLQPPEKKAYSVEQYNKAVHLKMKSFPRTWVKGVLTQVDARGKAVYMTLADFAEGDSRPRAVLPVMMWAREFEAFSARFAQLPTPFQIRNELKVSFLVESDFYVQSGRFQPKVVDIDESFTLGELALTRQKILETLKREGLLEKNKRLPFPPLPLRVGLISARGSAAYQDFTTVLLQSGFSFEVSFVEARMQGAATETTVRDALRRFSRLPPEHAVDVICLVRGGGSKTDLVFFDSEMICRAIADSPVPVLTGIGHEIDRSLADIVAYSDLLTPTDCAKYLESQVASVWQRLVDQASMLREAWDAAWRDESHATVQKAERLRSSWDARRQVEAQRQSEAARQVASGAGRSLREGREKLATNATGLLRGPGKLARLERLRFLNKSARMGHLWGSRYLQESSRQVNMQLSLSDSSRRLAARARDKLALARTGLVRGPEKHLRHAEEALGLKDRLLRASDPEALLKRGFSMILGPARKLVRSLQEVQVGQEIRIRFADGEATALISEKVENKELP